MILITKIKEEDYNNYTKNFTESLNSNINNSVIKKIIIFTDAKDLKVFNKKVIISKIRADKSEADIIEEVKKSHSNMTIMWSNPFCNFDSSLSKLHTIDDKSVYYIDSVFNNIINKNSNDVIIFNSNVKTYYDSRNKLNSLLDLFRVSNINISDKIKVSNKRPNIFINNKSNIKRIENVNIKSSKIDVIIVSVNYNDFLLLSLTNNKKYIGNITVVTSSSDTDCQDLCNKLGVKCVITDRMYENGAEFNKGKAINDGIKSIINPDWILVLDSDIILTGNIDLNKIGDDNFYTSGRYLCNDYTSYKKWQNNEITIENIGKFEKNNEFGFFQLFNFNCIYVNKKSPYPESFNDASNSDLEFKSYFPNKAKIDIDIIHLGEPYKNWKGRITDKFISDDIYNRLTKRVEVFDFNINEYFDKIYCINLERRKDRWSKVSQQFIQFKINVEKWTAVDGENISDELFQTFNPKNITGEEASEKGIVENKNSIGCLLSHLEVIKDARSKGYKKILIFEDDVIIGDDFLDRIKEIVDINWKLLYVGCSQFNWNKLEYKDNFYLSKNSLGTFGYCLDISTYDDIISLLENRNNIKSVDNLLSDFQNNNYGNCYTIYPNIVISDVSESDIRNTKSIVEYSKIVKWNLDKFNNISYFERIKSTTIIIPCYGHSKYLEECIDSCLSQSIISGRILVLLMDEDSILMKSKIEKKSNIIKCIISEKMKLSEARNFCVDKIETEYFIPLDADDKIPENFIEEICKIKSDVVYIGSEYFGSKSGFWPDPITEEINWTRLTTFRRNSLVCTALIKKESFIKSGKYNESLWAFEDMDLWIRMYKNDFIFKKCFSTKLLYRKNLSSDSLLSKANSNEENKKELKKIIMCDDFYKRTPKIIHWVWIGNNPIPEEVVKTWKKNLPEEEWTYMLWNEDNFDMNSCEFLKKSYESKKYGICVDYIRAKVLYEYGGVWLDADCLIKNDISPFLQYDFFGSWENTNYLNIGLIGCSSKMNIVKGILDYYTNINIDDDIMKNNHRFVKEIGTGPMVLTNELMKIKNIINGGYTNDFIFNNKKYLIETPDVFVLDDSTNGRVNYAIHLFDGSWTEKKEEWSVVVKNSYNSWKIKNKL